MSVKIVVSTLATGTPDPVNLEQMVTFFKDKDQRLQPSMGSFKLVFQKGINSAGPKEIVWNYTKEEDRDCEYDKLIEQNGTKL